MDPTQQWIKDRHSSKRRRCIGTYGKRVAVSSSSEDSDDGGLGLLPPLAPVETGVGAGSSGSGPVASEGRAKSPSPLDALAMEGVINADAAMADEDEEEEEEEEETIAAAVPPRSKRKVPVKPRQPKASKQKNTGLPLPLPRPPPPTRPSGKLKPGDYSPWWKRPLEPIYAQVPHGAAGATLAATPLRSTPGKRQASSWFSVKTMPLTHTRDGATGYSTATGDQRHIPWRVLMSIDPQDVWSEENGAAYRTVADAKTKPPESKPVDQTRCRTTCMRLTNAQKRLLRLWMGAYRFTYNQAVKLLRSDKRWKDASCQYLNEQLVYEIKKGFTTRDTSTDEKKAASDAKGVNMDLKRTSLGVEYGALVRKHPWLASVPSAIRKEACRDVAKAEKSNEGMRKSKPRHKWSLKYKKRSDASAWTMSVPVQCLLEAFVEPRPETRRPRTDGQPHKQVGRRDWTRVRMCSDTPLGDVWLTEALPDTALKSWMGGRGKSRRLKHTIAKGCRITLDKRGRFHMIVPYPIEAVPPTAKPLEERKVGAVDPGDRVQATVCSPNDGEVVSYAIGRENGGKDRIFKQCEKLDKAVKLAKARKPEVTPDQAERKALLERIAPLKRERDRVKADTALDSVQREALLKRLRSAINAMVAARYRKAGGGGAVDSPSQSRTRRRHMAVVRQKVKDLVTEAHRKIALDMVRRWDTLILPPFCTHDMVKRPKGGARKLNSKVARSLMNWRHYQFKLHAKAVFLRAGKELVSPDERYTSMTCGACGKLNAKHSKEEWTCKKCNVFHLRDPSASRCIFIKPFDQSKLPNGIVVDPKARGRLQPTNIPDASGQMKGETQ